MTRSRTRLEVRFASARGVIFRGVLPFLMVALTLPSIAYGANQPVAPSQPEEHRVVEAALETLREAVAKAPDGDSALEGLLETYEGLVEEALWQDLQSGAITGSAFFEMTAAILAEAEMLRETTAGSEGLERALDASSTLLMSAATEVASRLVERRERIAAETDAR